MADFFFDAMFALLGSFSFGRRRVNAENLAQVPMWLITLGVGLCWIMLGGPILWMIAVAPAGTFRLWLVGALGPGFALLTTAFVYAVLTQMRFQDEQDGRKLAIRFATGGLGLLGVGLGVLVMVGIFAFLDVMMNMG
jgi:hypothetical protein